MNRRSFLSAVPVVALAASPAASLPAPIPPKERLKLAIAEIENIFRELYPDLKVRKHLSEIRDIDQYEPSTVQLVIRAA